MESFSSLKMVGFSVILLPIILSVPCQAQLSPGDLVQAHAHLDGIKNCSKCHKLGKRAVGPKCLDCHQEIAAMRTGSPGLHASEDFTDCTDCHSDHHGRDYELVYWPDGQENFSHEVLGYEMTGAHLKLNCRQCHNVKFFTDPGQLRAWEKNFDRTWLGLDRKCVSCHKDPHAGSLTGGQKQNACTHCHQTDKWKPATVFNHDNAEFSLTGKHQNVLCQKCHLAKGEPVTVGNRKVSVTVFKPQRHQSCTECHKDPHANTLGPNCTQCHSTEGWLQITGESFDHTKTKYPLEGRHVGVNCAQCHGQGRKKPRYAACQDCHRDAHDSVRLARPRLMECEKCHTLADFKPASYTMARHAESPFPLRGAHRAAPCLRCHKSQIARIKAKEVDTKSVYAKAVDLAPEYKECTDCHADPHLGQTVEIRNSTGLTGCLACHTENSWRHPVFDHSTTKFILENRHNAVACTACHKPTRNAGKIELTFHGTAKHCDDCHEDIHLGQFADRKTSDGAAIDCAACHVTLDWFAEKFDHDKDSRFQLRGGHEKVACRKCHIPGPDDNERVVFFKPLPVECKNCHGNTQTGSSVNQKGKP